MKSNRSPFTPLRRYRWSLPAALLACGLVVTGGCRNAVDVAAADPPATEPSSHGMSPLDHEVTAMGRPTATADTRTVAIVMPHDEPTFPDGPGRRQFLTACVVCHSPRYIAMQPPFNKTVWATEVHKMVTAYGAHVTPEEEAAIVTYIMTIRGAHATESSHHLVAGSGGPR
jgi:mono/diheme cytochrome c family protein